MTSYGELARVFLRISLLGFGGPNAHLALMLDEIVERRRWITRERFLELMAVTNLLPGPNSSEVAIHIGHTQRGWRGALVTGSCFVAPTFVLVVLLSHLYFRHGTLPAVETLFRTLAPIVVAIILAAGWKLGRAAITAWWLVPLAALGVVSTLLLGGWQVAAMALGGAAAWLLGRRGVREKGEQRGDGSAAPPRANHGFLVLLPLAGAVAAGELARLFAVMLGTGAVLFGGGYMLVALLEPQVVDAYGWLTRQQFLDGIALTQAVPGPIVTLVAFIGYAVGGVPGAGVATLGIYIPSFAAVLLVAPRVERWRGREGVRAALSGVNAVVAGAILGVAITLLRTAVPDAWSGVLLAAALIAHLALGIGAVWLVAAGVLMGTMRALLGV